MYASPIATTTNASTLSRRAWPLAFSALSLVAALSLWFAWEPLVMGRSGWLTPGDIWSAYRSAHYVGWGDFGGVYAAGTNLVTFPAMLLLLAPLAMVTGAMGLSENLPFTLAHPTAWLALGPYEVLVGCLALFAVDALAERLGVARRRRAFLCAVQAVVLFNVTALWGHPEDALAVGLAGYALVLALDRRWGGAGWLFGAAMATQPLVILMFPVLLAMAGRRRAPAFGARALVPGAALLAVPLVADFRSTVHALVDQPNFPGVDHMTPWTALAPRLAGHGHTLAVAGGPGRVLALLLACALGIRARRWRNRPDLLVWGCALALALRCFTESVMDPYYVWPAVALGLVAAATCSGRRLVTTAALAVAVTVYGDFHLSQWVWWLPVTAAIVAVLGAGLPMNRVRLGLLVAPGTEVAARSGRGVLAGAAQ
jgi:hypothetical protein